jgi:hypothetical protein
VRAIRIGDLEWRMKKDVKQLVQLYIQWGWKIDKTNGGHLRFRGPKGELVYSASTPSDWRALANLRAQLKRATAAKIAVTWKGRLP